MLSKEGWPDLSPQIPSWNVRPLQWYGHLHEHQQEDAHEQNRILTNEQVFSHLSDH